MSSGRGGDRGWRFVLGLRKILAVGLAAFGLVVAVYFATHLRRPGGTDRQSEPLPPQKVERQEEPRYLEFNRDLSRMEIKAPRSYLGSDGLYHLEGEPGRPVTIV
ncbi:MAG: hypothetical protein PHI34_07900, partial [Acidobacteriota bacterium]|nr:hypothetical protein [Acidobacteriota bacterium]